MPALSRFCFVALCLLVPTWSYADWWKKQGDRTGKIKLLNTRYLGVSLLSFGTLWFVTWNDISAVQSPAEGPWARPWAFAWRLLWAWFLTSRCTEIGFAFLRDAYDKIDDPDGQSDLEPRGRLVLAFKSYGELILNFAMLFALCPRCSWMLTMSPPAEPHSVTDALYFSATTITTSGNGAMIPAQKLLQFLSTYEIFCGVILLVVCFTIYTGLGKGKCPPGPATGSGRQNE